MTSNFQAKGEALQREQTSINFQFLGVICALLDPLITTGSSPSADPKHCAQERLKIPYRIV